MLKVILLLRRREGMSVEDFRRHWREVHAPLLLQLPGLRRLVFNYGRSDEAGRPPAYDGISEDWFASAEAMELAFASPQGEAVAADAPNFVDVSRIQTLVVEEDEVEVPGQSTGD
jgi:uncharacterized protein (TIGR02118 family)